MSVLASSPEEQLQLVATRVLRHYVSAFGQWWAEFGKDEQESLLAGSVAKSPALGPGGAQKIREGTQDPIPICHLIEVVGPQKGLLPEDAQVVRTYRNDLHHAKVNAHGQLAYAQPSRVRRFMQAAARLAEGFRAPQEHAAIVDLDAHVTEVLGASTVAPELPLPPPPRAPRIDEPRFPLPSAKPSKRAAMDPDDAALESQLSADQRTAIDQVVSWYHGKPSAADGLSYYALAGPAGSGKTTVTGLVVRRLALKPEQVALLAPTGKAVQALKARLPRGWKSRARTLASFLWRWKFTGYRGEDNEFVNQGEKPVDAPIALVIVDEASMLTAEDFKALSRYRRVLYTGDPDQLPPVEAECADVLASPHARLNVIHRQEDGSSIRLTAQAARENQFPSFGTAADGRVQYLAEDAGHIGADEVRRYVDWADVILTQRNSLRVTINEYVRRRRGFMTSPVDYVPKSGEILVCSENFQHPVKGIRVANGERFVIRKVLGTVSRRPDEAAILDYTVVGHPEGREHELAEWTISSQMLAGDQIRGAVLETEHVSGPRSNVLRADWGYALTVHKAQGSEWPKVLIVDDLNPDHKVPQNKWHYVAYSRAIDQLVILKVRRNTLLFMPSSAKG